MLIYCTEMMERRSSATLVVLGKTICEKRCMGSNKNCYGVGKPYVFMHSSRTPDTEGLFTRGGCRSSRMVVTYSIKRKLKKKERSTHS